MDEDGEQRVDGCTRFDGLALKSKLLVMFVISVITLKLG